MIKVHCFTDGSQPVSFCDNTLYFELLSNKASKSVSSGLPLLNLIRKFGIVPSVAALDFALFALSIVTVDKAVSRSSSEDGWTRRIELTITLQDVDTWSKQKQHLEKMLRFLTGDFWNLRFLPAQLLWVNEQKEKFFNDHDCVCLLSGGVDSLVGAINLVEEGVSPLFVSQIIRGDASRQRRFASVLGNNNHHQWSVGKQVSNENSTRARSIMFFAFAVLSATSLNAPIGRTKIIIPENGFISLNIPLSTNRIASLSTKTTHPVYMTMLQELWDAIGLIWNSFCH